ncbi:hypothetical protein [Yersinia intermedia]|uniref:hypothetical protein n=1 Tax=Yersinia intermedia TaxID=631 RepID=UPI0011AAEB14|nr:hypothetical protein [Yersinia intermedia]
MKAIAVDKKGLMEDFITWGVAPNYARFFLAKCKEANDQILLEPFMFNDSEHLTNQYQWFAANSAFWCRVYREAECNRTQGEALASIRSIFFVAGMLGQGSIAVMIRQWWHDTHELHGLPCPNQSQLSTMISHHFH